MSERVVWTFIHGSFLGGLFTLAFAAAVVGLFSTRAQWATAGGVRGRLPGLRWATPAKAFFGWATVIRGTWIVYPWYRAPIPPGRPVDRLKEYPREFLLSNPATSIWHTFGMEWKGDQLPQGVHRHADADRARPDRELPPFFEAFTAR